MLKSWYFLIKIIKDDLFMANTLKPGPLLGFCELGWGTSMVIEGQIENVFDLNFVTIQMHITFTWF